MVGSVPSEPVVSVIIPVHNGEAHLRECLDSVLTQTLDGLEVIVVDDASTDSTGQILHEYEQAARGDVRLITQGVNQGVSAARNRGLEAARGTYLAFVDADDMVRPRMYEHLVETAERLRVDVVSCAIQLLDDRGVLSRPVPYPMTPGVRHDERAVRTLLETGFTSKLLWFPSRSVYRRSLVKEHGIQFDSQIRKGEDSLFNLEVLNRAHGCAAVTDSYYLYRKHAASVTARPLESESANLEALGDRVTEHFRRWEFPPLAVDDFYRYVLSSDLPTALVRLTGGMPSGEQLKTLRASHHVRVALADLPRLNPNVPTRVRLLLLLFKYLPVPLVTRILSLSRRVRTPSRARASLVG